MNNFFYVYEHWRLDRDECFYVGKGKGNRAYNTQNRNCHHKAIVAKLNRIGSAFEIKMVATGLQEQEAFNLERKRILFWKNVGVDLVNLTDGGEGLSGHNFSIEHREKLSLAHKGRSLSEEQKLKISKSNKGRKKPEEAVARSAATRKGMKASDNARKNMSLAHVGKKRQPLSSETKNKISIAHIGKKVSSETKAKLSASHKNNTSAKGHVCSNESKKLMAQKRKEYWEKRKNTESKLLIKSFLEGNDK